jgi:hypothetical protein
MMGGLFRGSMEAFRMATVQCDVRGGTFNQSYLGSHKRLAHEKNKRSDGSETGEEEAIQTTVALHGNLSAAGRRRVVRLINGRRKKNENNSQG